MVVIFDGIPLIHELDDLLLREALVVRFHPEQLRLLHTLEASRG